MSDELLRRLDLMASHRTEYQSDPIAEAAARIRNLEAEMWSWKMASKEAELECGMHRSAVADMTARLAAAEGRVTVLSAAVDDAVGALDGAGEQLSEFADILSRDPWEANQAYQSARDLNAALSALEPAARIRDLEAQLAALTARLAAADGRVKVKPLVWEFRAFDVHKVWSADIYDIWVSSDYHRMEGIGEDVRLYPTLEAAKDAAQADYTARILSALEPTPPDPLAEGLVAALCIWDQALRTEEDEPLRIAFDHGANALAAYRDANPKEPT